MTIRAYKKILCAAVFSVASLISTAWATSSATPIQSVNGIAAIVNKDVITDTQLNTALDNARAQIQAQHAQMPSAAALRTQVLNQIIDQELMIQVAKHAKITVSKTDIDKAIEGIAKNNHLTVSALKQKVTANGQSYAAYQKEIHRQMLISKVQQQALASQIQVTKSDINTLIAKYNQHQAATRDYHVSDILIPVSDMSNKKDVSNAKNRAEEIYTKLSKGADFSKIAKLESGGATALKGGDMGWLTGAQLPTIFVDQLSHMKVGQVSKPIKAGNGFHILKLTGVKKNSQTLSQTEARNILLQEQLEKKVKKWVNTLRKTAYIKIM